MSFQPKGKILNVSINNTISFLASLEMTILLSFRLDTNQPRGVMKKKWVLMGAALLPAFIVAFFLLKAGDNLENKPK